MSALWPFLMLTNCTARLARDPGTAWSIGNGRRSHTVILFNMRRQPRPYLPHMLKWICKYPHRPGILSATLLQLMGLRHKFRRRWTIPQAGCGGHTTRHHPFRLSCAEKYTATLLQLMGLRSEFSEAVGLFPRLGLRLSCAAKCKYLAAPQVSRVLGAALSLFPPVSLLCRPVEGACGGADRERRLCFVINILRYALKEKPPRPKNPTILAHRLQ